MPLPELKVDSEYGMLYLALQVSFPGCVRTTYELVPDQVALDADYHDGLFGIDISGYPSVIDGVPDVGKVVNAVLHLMDDRRDPESVKYQADLKQDPFLLNAYTVLSEMRSSLRSS